MPRRRKPEAAMSIPTSAEVGSILASCEPSFRAFVVLCAFAGLRLGEAAGVQVGDIDFLRRTLRVSRQVQRAGGGEVEIGLPKYGSERNSHLWPTAEDRTRSAAQQMFTEAVAGTAETPLPDVLAD